MQRCKSERSSCAKVEKLIQVGIALRAILGESRQLGWHAVPTLPDTKRTKGDRGAGSWRGGAVSVIRNLYSVISLLSASPHSHWHLTDLW